MYHMSATIIFHSVLEIIGNILLQVIIGCYSHVIPREGIYSLGLGLMFLEPIYCLCKIVSDNCWCYLSLGVCIVLE